MRNRIFQDCVLIVLARLSHPAEELATGIILVGHAEGRRDTMPRKTHRRVTGSANKEGERCSFGKRDAYLRQESATQEKKSRQSVLEKVLSCLSVGCSMTLPTLARVASFKEAGENPLKDAVVSLSTIECCLRMTH